LSEYAKGKPEAVRKPLKMRLKPDVESISIGRLVELREIWLIWWIGLIRVNRAMLAGFSET